MLSEAGRGFGAASLAGDEAILRSLAALERKGHPPMRIKSHAATELN